jgi:hypothetical protein
MMTMTPKQLQEEIQRLTVFEWRRYQEGNPPKGQAQLYYKDNAEYWQDGFRAALALMQEREGKLSEALKWCVKIFSEKADGMGEVAVIENAEDALKELGVTDDET